MKAPAIWACLVCAVSIPVLIAATSPFQASRNAVYIIGGMAGVITLALLLVQPLLASGALPGLTPPKARKYHQWIGGMIVLGVLAHVGGLYLTSPPDALDALLLVSPTPFSVYGVIGLWTVIATALLAAFRKKLGLRPKHWRWMHNALTLVIVVSTIIHAVMIQGAMGYWSKLILCGCVLVAMIGVTFYLRVIKPRSVGT